MASVTQMKLLCRGIEVMELQRPLTARIATDDALPACFFNEGLLHHPMALRNRFDSTSSTSIKAAALQHKLSRTMSPTGHDCPLGIARRSLSPPTWRVNLIASHPIANGRNPSAQLLRHLSQGQAIRYEFFETLLVNRSL